MVFTCAFFLSRLRGLTALIAGTGSGGSFVGLKRQMTLGVIFGLLASTEVFFPGMRSPYVFHTLVVCLACFLAGRRAALISILIVVLCSLANTTLPTTEFTAFAICLVAIVCLAVRSVVPNPSPVVVAGSGAFGQALVVLTSRFLLHDLGLTPAADLYSASVLANGLGLLMVMYVLKDAESRSREEKLKLDAEHYRTLALSAELKALRAQIRPHFLFNVLTAIAALCRIDSERAETLVLKLGRLLRRNLEDSPSTATTVERELDFVKTYLDIQKARHEKVVNEIRCSPGMEKMEIPAFSIQTLVENAYNHGFSFGGTNGNVLVAITRSSKSIFVSVSDNGVGMPQSPIVDDQKRGDRIPHGLNIVDRQLRIQFGDQARLRFYSFPNRGTIAAFKIPRV